MEKLKKKKVILITALCAAAILVTSTGLYFATTMFKGSSKTANANQNSVNQAQKDSNSNTGAGNDSTVKKEGDDEIQKETERRNKIEEFAKPAPGSPTEMQGDAGHIDAEDSSSSNDPTSASAVDAMYVVNGRKILDMQYLNLDRYMFAIRRIKYSVAYLIPTYKKTSSLNDKDVTDYYNKETYIVNSDYGINSADDLKRFVQSLDFLNGANGIKTIELLNDGLSKKDDTINCKIKVTTDNGNSKTFDISVIFTDNYAKLVTKYNF